MPPALQKLSLVLQRSSALQALALPRWEIVRLFLRGQSSTQLAEMVRQGELLAEHGERIPIALCGHTHFAREGRLGPTRGYNIGGDYHFKRLLRFDWPLGEVRATEFGEK